MPRWCQIPKNMSKINVLKIKDMAGILNYVGSVPRESFWKEEIKASLDANKRQGYVNDIKDNEEDNT
ncbi:hypothetical protein HPP92_020642 [Vanilla planifolia]|uniref:Uncharacterized protein n=1 Tax=Vanilla planifolia TaxID=51239 RepID=A0A835Q127_VANPL|nr:hypothetical protein HPP92_020642 [Vanilla planifolia]